MLLTYLNRPYPFFYGKTKTNIIMFFLASIFVVHTMLIMRPNTIVSKIHTNYVTASVVFSLITFAIAQIWAKLTVRLFPNDVANWKVYKELILTISCILVMGILNYIYILLFGSPTFGFDNFNYRTMVEVISFTLFSGLIPLLVITLINFLKMEVKRKNSINTATLQPDSGSTMLCVQEGAETIRVDLHEVALIESMGNYVKIYQHRNSTNNILTVRLTMKRLEQLIQQQKFMMRIHRSYLVNVNRIELVHKSFTGDLSLSFFQHKDLRIPVSRNKKKELFDSLKNTSIIAE